MKALTKKDKKDWDDAVKSLEKIEKKIRKRITYILEQIGKVSKSTFHMWTFLDDENLQSSFSLDKDSIVLYCEYAWNPDSETTITLKKGLNNEKKN